MIIIICDIDGTVCDSTARIDEITNKYNLENIGRWTEDHINEFTRPEYIKNDKVIPGAEILPELARIMKAKLMFLTGRNEQARDSTRLWLKRELKVFDSVPLIMRTKHDMSDPSDCKIEIFKNTVLKMFPDSHFIFFDDDEKLLGEYAKYGLALRAPGCWENIRFSADKQLSLFDMDVK
jgi:uncharacterized HAD superfamily protein